MKNNGRYKKQELFSPIGASGQRKLSESSVLIIGAGATGGAEAALLVRAGIGRLRIVDRDFLELSNLNRQILYDNDDIETGLPKAVLAERHLRAMNPDVEIEGIVAHVDSSNIDDFADGVDLIIDGLDNQASRYLINDYAVKHKLPWIWVGCLGSSGNVMAVIPDRTPCMRCILEQPAPPGFLPTCDTFGIIGPAPLFVASIAATEALKILSGNIDAVSTNLTTIDLWKNHFHTVDMARAKKDDCPCCGKQLFEFLEGRNKTETETMCGIDAVQIVPPKRIKFDLPELAGRLEQNSIVTYNDYLLQFKAEKRLFSVFPDGRVIIHGVEDHGQARTLYDRYIGS